MSAKPTALEKLKFQEKELKKKIRAAQTDEAKKKTKTQAEKHRIIGAAIIAELEENTPLKATIQPVIEKRTTSPKDRILLGLKPLPKTTK